MEERAMTVPTVLQPAPTAADLQQLAELYQKYPFLFPRSDPRERVTVGEVIDHYMQHAADEMGQEALSIRTYHLLAFRESFGERRAVDITVVDLRHWLTANGDRWRTGHTRCSVNGTLQRAFNWAALEARLIPFNPVHGFRGRWHKKDGRDMKPEELQALLRHTDPHFRRFLIALKLTGARPGELRTLKWKHIDWERGVAVLPEHKTLHKTGKPRVIVLVRQVLKMLAYIKLNQHGPAAVELRRILVNSLDRIARRNVVVKRMKGMGFTIRQIYRAKVAIGAVHRRTGGWREHGYTVYELPKDAVEKPAPAGDYVFTCSKQHRWTRQALITKFSRLREEIGLPDDCKLYSTRHLFASWAVKNDVNLKAIATLLGHTTCVMVDRVYAHVNGDYKFLHQAAAQAVGLNAPATPLPPDEQSWEKVLLTEYPKAVAKPRKPKPTGPKPLNDAQKIAYQAHQFAVAEAPHLRTDAEVYEWLIGRPEFAGQLPPSISSFRRYLHYARCHFEGAGKRKARRLKHEKGSNP